MCVEQIRDITAMTQSDSFYAPLSLFLHPNILFSPAYNTAITATNKGRLLLRSGSRQPRERCGKGLGSENRRKCRLFIGFLMFGGAEFFNNCQQSVVLRNSLTKKLFLMFLAAKRSSTSALVSPSVRPSVCPS